MWTIGRSRRQRPPAASPAIDGEVLSPRAVRLRNICLRRIAAVRGLPPPSAGDLATLSDRVRLAAALAWWEQTSLPATARTAEAADAAPRARPGIIARAAFAASVALLALALLPAPVQ